jgi:hypothetical protein
MPGYNSQRLGTANTLPNLLVVLFFFVSHVVVLLIVMFCVLFVSKCVLPPGVNSITVDKYININIKTNYLVVHNSRRCEQTGKLSDTSEFALAYVAILISICEVPGLYLSQMSDRQTSWLCFTSYLGKRQESVLK